MVQTRNNNPQLYINGLIHSVWDSEQANEMKPEYTELFEINTSKKSVEEEVGITGFIQAPEKAEGTPFQYDTATQTYLSRYFNKPYGLGFSLTREAIADNLYGDLIKRLTPSLRKSMMTTKEVTCANVFNNGFSGGPTGGDGVVLLSLSHPTPYGNQANITVTAADLTYTAVTDMIVKMGQALDDKGKPAPLMPRKLAVPMGLYKQVQTILGTPGVPGVGDNDINVLYTTNAMKEGWCINHYFTDQNAWFILTDANDGLKFFQREKLELVDVPATASNSGDVAVRAYERYSAGWSNWRGVYGSPGTT